MSRTSAAAVKLVLGADYDTVNSPDLTPYIDAASLVVDDVATCATDQGETLSSGKLEMVERFMAAHYYTQSDPIYKSRSTLSASGAFGRKENPYQEVAIDLDATGCLNAIIKRQRVGATWLGKNPTDQIDYETRGGSTGGS